MSMKVTLHGPYTASVQTIHKTDGKRFGVVLLKSKDGVDVTMFFPDAEKSEAVAAAINAAFARKDETVAA